MVPEKPKGVYFHGREGNPRTLRRGNGKKLERHSSRRLS